jgi:hypothetical protein
MYLQENPQTRKTPHGQYPNRQQLHPPTQPQNINYDDMYSQGSYQLVENVPMSRLSNSKQNQSNIEMDKITYLVKDINKDLDNYGPSKTQLSENSDVEDSDSESDSDVHIKNKKSINKNDDDNDDSNFILDIIKECGLLLFLYVLISQEFVRKGINTTIPQIVGENDTVHIIGYMVYGTILAFMFVFFKRILI